MGNAAPEPDEAACGAAGDDGSADTERPADLAERGGGAGGVSEGETIRAVCEALPGRKEGAALAVLRTSVGAPRSSGRDTDAQYAFGRIKSAFQTVRELNVLGDKILGKLSPEKAAEALVMLEQIRGDVVPLKVKLEEIIG